MKINTKNTPAFGQAGFSAAPFNTPRRNYIEISGEAQIKITSSSCDIKWLTAITMRDAILKIVPQMKTLQLMTSFDVTVDVNPGETLIIDTDLCEVRKDGVPVLQGILGSFFKIPPGVGTLSFDRRLEAGTQPDYTFYSMDLGFQEMFY